MMSQNITTYYSEPRTKQKIKNTKGKISKSSPM